MARHKRPSGRKGVPVRRPKGIPAHLPKGVPVHRRNFSVLPGSRDGHKGTILVKSGMDAPSPDPGAGADPIDRMYAAASRHVYDRNYPAALAEYERIAAAGHNSSRLHSCLGSVLTNLGRHEESISEFDAAIALDPEEKTSYVNRAVPLVHLGRKQEVLKSLERALEIDPTYAHAHINKAVILAGMRRFLEADECMAAAIKYDPETAARFADALGP